MDIDIIFKIAAIGVIIAILNQILVKSGKEEIATLVTVSGLVIVLLMVITLISNLFVSIRGLFGLY